MHIRESRLIDFSRSDLSPGVRRRVARHLQRCPDCRTRLARLEVVRENLRSTPLPSTPDRFEVVLERLDAGEVMLLPDAPSPRQPGRSRRRVASVVGAALVVAGGAAGAVVHESLSEPMPVGAGVAVPMTVDRLDVAVPRGSQPVSVQVELTDDAVVDVSATAPDGAPRFESTSSAVIVHGVAGGHVEVRVPRSARHVVIKSGNRTLMEVRDGSFHMRVSGRVERDVVQLEVPASSSPPAGVDGSGGGA